METAKHTASETPAIFSSEVSGQKAAYFISDLHLGARTIPDRRRHEARVVRFLDSIADDCGELFLLGDILDYWFEYRTVVPRGYVRFFGALARLADRGVKITWFIGNHDIWLFDYLRDEIGITVGDGSLIREIDGKKFYLAHGDQVGKRPLGFRIIQKLFRNRFCQMLYAAIHPRWTVGFAHWWSASNRDFGHRPEPVFRGMDTEPQAIFAREYLRDVDPDINYFVFGHTHVAVNEPLSPACRFVILGDWIWHDTYGVYDEENFKIQQFVSYVR